MVSPNAHRADLLGMANSLICLLHCMAMPVLLSTGASFMANPLLELLFVALSAWAVHAALRPQAPRVMKITLWTLWLLFAGALLLEHHLGHVEWVGFLASGGLVAGHLFNYRKRLKLRGVLANE